MARRESCPQQRWQQRQPTSGTVLPADFLLSLAGCARRHAFSPISLANSGKESDGSPNPRREGGIPALLLASEPRREAQRGSGAALAPTLSGGGPRLPPFPRRRHVRVRLPPRLLRAHRQPGAAGAPRPSGVCPAALGGFQAAAAPSGGSPRGRLVPQGAGRLRLRSPLRRPWARSGLLEALGGLRGRAGCGG